MREFVKYAASILIEITDDEHNKLLANNPNFPIVHIGDKIYARFYNVLKLYIPNKLKEIHIDKIGRCGIILSDSINDEDKAGFNRLGITKYIVNDNTIQFSIKLSNCYYSYK